MVQVIETLVAGLAQYAYGIDDDIDILHGANPIGRVDRTREIFGQMLDIPMAGSDLTARNSDDVMALAKQGCRRRPPMKPDAPVRRILMAARTKILRKVLRRACISGTCASVTSTAAMAFAGSRDCRSAFAPVNAVSHWVWKDHAIHQDAPTLRYTATGYLIHHIASLFWAVFYEALAPFKRRRSKQEVILDATAITALAATIDLRCTPERLTPGFERRLDTKGLLLAYGAFGLGLAVSAYIHLADDGGDH